LNFDIQKLHICSGHRGSVYCLEHAWDPGHFLSSGEDGTVALWKLKAPDLGKPLVQMQHSVYTLKCCTEKGLLAIFQNQSGLHFFDYQNQKETARISIPGVSFFDSGVYKSRLFAVDSAGFLSLFNLDTLKLDLSIKISEKSLRCLSIDSLNGLLYLGASDHFIYVLDINSLEAKFKFLAHGNSVFSMLYHEGQIFSAGRDARIKAWSVIDIEKPQQEVPAHLYTINNLCLIKEFNLIASGSMDRTIKLWDASNLKLLKVINKAKHASHGHSVNKLLWLENEKVLISGADDRLISLWSFF
jgi:WD40 repeat protein